MLRGKVVLVINVEVLFYFDEQQLKLDRVDVVLDIRILLQ